MKNWSRMMTSSYEITMATDPVLAPAANAPPVQVWVRWMTSRRRSYMMFCEFSLVERIGIVKQGLPAIILVTLANDMSVPREVLFGWLGIPRATANRKVRENAVLTQNESERALGIARVVGQVSKIVLESGNDEGFDAAKWTAAWLDRPNPAFGGRRPGGYMDTTDGRELVAGLVAQMQSGAYA